MFQKNLGHRSVPEKVRIVLKYIMIRASITKAEQVPRCHELVTANGDVTYIGNRERHTHAHITCDEGYSVGKDGVETVQCLQSLQWESTLHCYKPCDTPIIQNGRLRVGLSNRNYSRATIVSGQMVSVSCEDNFFLYDNRKNEFIKERSFFIKCTLGKIKTIPSCRKESCELPDDPYASYYVNGERYTGNTITHEGNVRVVCEEGTSITVSSDVRTCWNGAWKSGMEFPDVPSQIGVDDYYSYRDYFDLETNDTHFTLTCTNGTIGNKKCELSQDSKDQQENMHPTMKPSSSVYETTTVPSAQTTSPIHKYHGVLDCTIPESTDVHFVTLSGGELKEGTQECKNYYEGYYLNYEDADGEVTSPPVNLVNTHVNCTDGVISNYTLVCDDVDTSDTAVTISEECKTVPNGNVTDNGQSVECNEGYVNANSLSYERYSCYCDRNIPALVCNGRQAKCKPVNCKIDRPIEQGMTLIHKGRFVTSSSIEAIDHGESVVFNCEIGRNDITYEPRNRLFKCDRGKWLEHNRRGVSWSLGNNGMFPKCRPAKCECQNGGTCIRDEMCKCPPFSTGQQCETYAMSNDITLISSLSKPLTD
ncbi:hypothetical protein MAR_033704 [Mya arenaria]|uniref:EGF-like domain-containing protein n=1 Tax=Mya arenaria TaxID=6604 RepID=A0ABY7G9R8_MYAAR|nr:hypothetical protein MAR_033704 [Mya arenaria]